MFNKNIKQCSGAVFIKKKASVQPKKLIGSGSGFYFSCIQNISQNKTLCLFFPKNQVILMLI